MGTDRRWGPHNPCDVQEHVEHVLIYLSLWCFCRISRSERTGRYGADMRKHDPECYGKRSRDVEKDYDRRWVHDRYKDYCDERRDQDSPEVSGEEFLCGLMYVLIRVILNLLFLKLNITLLYFFSLTEEPKTTQQQQIWWWIWWWISRAGLQNGAGGGEQNDYAEGAPCPRHGGWCKLTVRHSVAFMLFKGKKHTKLYII